METLVSNFFLSCFWPFRFRLFVLLPDRLQIFQNHFETLRFTLNHHNQNWIRVHQEYWREQECLGKNGFTKFKNYRKLLKKKKTKKLLQKLSVKNIDFSNVANLRSLGISKVANLLLVNFIKMNVFRSFEDHLDFE